MKSKNLIIVAIVAVGLAGLFLYPRLTDPARGAVREWKAANIDCLPSHQRAALHIHPSLEILVDGTREPISHDVGVVRTCMAEIHTHDNSGTLHVESVVASKVFTLGQFLAVYGKTVERPGYALEMTVDGAPSAELGGLKLRDKQRIVLTYTKESEMSNAPSE